MIFTKRKPDTLIQKMTYERYMLIDMYERAAKAKSDLALKKLGVSTYEEDLYK